MPWAVFYTTRPSRFGSTMVLTTFENYDSKNSSKTAIIAPQTSCPHTRPRRPVQRLCLAYPQRTPSTSTTVLLTLSKLSREYCPRCSAFHRAAEAVIELVAVRRRRAQNIGTIMIAGNLASR